MQTLQERQEKCTYQMHCTLNPAHQVAVCMKATKSKHKKKSALGSLIRMLNCYCIVLHRAFPYENSVLARSLFLSLSFSVLLFLLFGCLVLFWRLEAGWLVGWLDGWLGWYRIHHPTTVYYNPNMKKSQCT